MQRLKRAAAAISAGLVAATACARSARAEEGDRDARADDARAEAEAKAAEDAALFARAKGVKIASRLGVRFLQTAPFSKVYQHVLTGYGYGSMSALLEGAVDVGLSPASWLDLGAHAGYAFGSAGSAGGSGGVLTLHSFEVGGFAYGIFGRTDSRRPGTFGVGVEGGGMFPLLLLRGDVTGASVPYVAPAALLRLAGTGRVSTVVHLRYVIANWPGAFGSVGLPLGGISISVGANVSL